MSVIVIQEIREKDDGRKYEYIKKSDGSEAEHFLPTDLEKAASLKKVALSQIKTELSEAVAFDNTEEIARCKQAYRDLNGGLTIETKTEVIEQRDKALLDSRKWFKIGMKAKGWLADE